MDRLLGSPAFQPLLALATRSEVADLLRVIQHEQRATFTLTGVDEESYAAAVRARLDARQRNSLQRVINATGVILHTNLGRAPLAPQAIQAITDVAAGYSNLEYDLALAGRGSRYDHCRTLLCELTGAADALVVNNNAAALVLALNTISAERATIVSRGELVEIGGSFRVPEIMARSGARMHEVGATNRAHRSDYYEAIGPDSAVILKVHRSNFRMSGFTSEVPVAELAELAHSHELVLLHDLGSGLLLDLRPFGFPEEPTPGDSLLAGADLVTLSGDKLLGGPQAGIMLGRADLIEAMRRNPLCRAMRVDKLTLAALTATLDIYRKPEAALATIPVLRMLTTAVDQIRDRATALESRLRSAGLNTRCLDTVALVGGGAYPDVEIPSAGIQLDAHAVESLDERLRQGQPPVITRTAQDRVILDLRTVDPSEDAVLERRILDAALN